MISFKVIPVLCQKLQLVCVCEKASFPGDLVLNLVIILPSNKVFEGGIGIIIVPPSLNISCKHNNYISDEQT